MIFKNQATKNAFYKGSLIFLFWVIIIGLVYSVAAATIQLKNDKDATVAPIGAANGPSSFIHDPSVNVIYLDYNETTHPPEVLMKSPLIIGDDQPGDGEKDIRWMCHDNGDNQCTLGAWQIDPFFKNENEAWAFNAHCTKEAAHQPGPIIYQHYYDMNPDPSILPKGEMLIWLHPNWQPYTKYGEEIIDRRNWDLIWPYKNNFKIWYWRKNFPCA